MAQQPTVMVNVRFTAEQVKALDLYRAHLASKRFSATNRSDVMRLALGKLPCPADAGPELRDAWALMTATFGAER